MASAQNLSSSLIPLLSLLLAISLSTTHADLVDDVCSKTSRPLTCIQVLRSDPRSKTPDPLALGFVVIDVATNQARSGKTLLESLLKGPTTDPKLKAIYSSCLENYGDSLDDIGNLSGFLRSKDYGSVGAYASAALSGPDTCNGSFSTPSDEPLPLKAASDKLQAICAAVLSINNKLQGH